MENNHQSAFQVYNQNGDQIWVGGNQEGQSPSDIYGTLAEGIYKSFDEIKISEDRVTPNNNGNKKILLDPRYADAILMMVEIENALGNDLYFYTNQIRQRVYGDNHSEAVAYKNGSFFQNELAILKERDKEFVGEGKRWSDLLRLQDAAKQPLVFNKDAVYAEDDYWVPVLDKATQSYMILWLIEVELINNDPLLNQTFGYPTKK